jgi:hypothetical protein
MKLSAFSSYWYNRMTRVLRLSQKRGLLVIEIIVALIAVFGVVFPYLFQRNKELNLKIADQKREAYASFLKNFTAVTVAVMHDEDMSGKDADMERRRHGTNASQRSVTPVCQ